MAQLYTAGEQKIRPGVYYRYSGQTALPAGAMDGVNAIVITASWGPAGVVTVHEKASSIEDTYGTGAGVDSAKQIFTAGAKTVYVYRPEGSGGAKGTATVEGGTITAKYVGARALSVKVQEKPGDATKKECIVLDGTRQLEKVEFVAGGEEGNALATAFAGSKYVDVAITASVIPAGTYVLEGGKDPTITPEDYLKGFQSVEPHRYNVLTTDSVDPAVTQLILAYADEAERVGKNIFVVVGDTTSGNFDAKLEAASACNDKKKIYFGSAYKIGEEVIEGAKAINHVAGIVSATPSNQSIVHTVISGATDLTEKLTHSQYEDAIRHGLLLLSLGPDGQVWFDSGVNTLISPAENEDDGWKKIKRTKVRFELFDRIDRVVAPLVGKINCDNDGVAAVIQAGMGVITSMISEKKLMPGAIMVEDPENPHGADSAWFIIQVDDIDALEKIYLHYQFRYSQNA